VVKACNALSKKIATRILNEGYHQSEALISLTNLRSMKMLSMQFAQSLHTIALDLQDGGQRMIMEQMAKTDQAGQTIKACLKEGYNINNLQKSGIATNNFIQV